MSAGQMLLINPAKRRGGNTKKRRKAPSAAQRANWARFAAMARKRASGARASNPIKARRRVGAKRKRNPIMGRARTVTRKRRRNPISLGGGMGSLFNFRSYIPPLKDAAVMGAGAVAMDVGFGYVNRYLPVSMQRVPGSVGVGDAVKAIITVALGKLLAKPTRGLSTKAAMGSLVCQFRDVTMAVLPASVTQMNGLGFVTAGRVVPQMNSRVNANQRAFENPNQRTASRTQVGAGSNVSQYVAGASPLLSQYVGGTPLLSGNRLGAFRR